MTEYKRHSTSQKVVSQEEIKRYLNGKLTNKQAHDLEKLALDDVFLQDALDGIDTVVSDLTVVTRFNTRLLSQKKKRNWSVWTAVASVAVITFGLFFHLQSKKTHDLAFEEQDVKMEESVVFETKINEVSEDVSASVEEDQKETYVTKPKPTKHTAKKKENIYPVVLDDEETPVEMESIEYYEEAPPYEGINSVFEEGKYLKLGHAYLPARNIFSSQEKHIENKALKKERAVTESEKTNEEVKTNRKAIAYQYIVNLEWEKALQTYEKVVAEGELDNEVRFYRAVAFVHQNNPKEALNDLNYLLEKSTIPKDILQWYMAVSYLKLESNEKATDLLKSLVVYKSSNYSYLAKKLLN